MDKIEGMLKQLPQRFASQDTVFLVGNERRGLEIPRVNELVERLNADSSKPWIRFKTKPYIREPDVPSTATVIIAMKGTEDSTVMAMKKRCRNSNLSKCVFLSAPMSKNEIAIILEHLNKIREKAPDLVEEEISHHANGSNGHSSNGSNGHGLSVEIPTVSLNGQAGDERSSSGSLETVESAEAPEKLDPEKMLASIDNLSEISASFKNVADQVSMSVIALSGKVEELEFQNSGLKEDVRKKNGEIEALKAEIERMKPLVQELEKLKITLAPFLVGQRR